MKINPPNGFWTENNLDSDMMSYLWAQIGKAKINAKDKLLGHISSSLELYDPEEKLRNYLKESSKELDHLYHPDIRLMTLWVNFQKKYEFNPIHVHSGTISFVIWMKIPYEYQNELRTEGAKGLTQTCRSGCFEISYLDILGQIHTYLYPLSPQYEGKIVMFSASQNHQVYPFYTSDETRISISGNLI
tara:strand:+ start:2877 stop:3440 length:564 start_codon:yes stop_codon:yes gene_type:complete